MNAHSGESSSSQRGWREIHRYAYVARPYEYVWPLLAGGAAHIFGAEPRPEGIGLELRVPATEVEVPPVVLLHVGGLVQLGDRALIPLSWADFDRPRLFPLLKGVVELAPADYPGQPITQIGLLGRYRPPLGSRNGTAERRGGGDIMVESVGMFVDELAARIEGELPPPVIPDRPAGERALVPLEPPWHRVFLPLDGLRYRAGGALATRRRLAGVPGVRSVEVDPLAAVALVEYDPGGCDLDTLVAYAEVDIPAGEAVPARQD